MRRGALALLLLATGCGQSGGDGNGSGATNVMGRLDALSESRDAAATLALSASGTGNCSARWDGQPATVQQVLERSSALIERALGQGGAATNMTVEALPTVSVTAPASLGFACADSYLSQIRRAGVPTILLQPDGVAEPALADFSLTDIAAPPPTVVVALGGGGRMTWNNEAIGLDAIPDRLRQLGGGGATNIEAPAGELELRPAREASFGQVHAALRTIRAGRVRAALLLPSVQPSQTPRPAPARPAPPAPAPDAQANRAGQ